MPPSTDPSSYKVDPAGTPPRFELVGRAVIVNGKLNRSTGDHFSKDEADGDPDKVRREYREKKNDQRIRTVFYYVRIKKKKEPGPASPDPASPDGTATAPPPPVITPGPIPDGQHPKPGSPPVVVTPPGGPGLFPLGPEGPPYPGIIRVDGKWYEIDLDTGDVARSEGGWTPSVTVKGGGKVIELDWKAPPPQEAERHGEEGGETAVECYLDCVDRAFKAWERKQQDPSKSQENQDEALRRIMKGCREHCGLE